MKFNGSLNYDIKLTYLNEGNKVFNLGNNDAIRFGMIPVPFNIKFSNLGSKKSALSMYAKED